jgi:hypothetical protein
MYRYLLLLVFIASLSSLVASFEDISSDRGFQFLKIPTATALAGMGNTGEMSVNTPMSVFHHPAAFEWQRGKHVAFSQSAWLVDTNIFTIAYRNIWFDRGFGLGIKYADYGAFEKRDDVGTLSGHYYPLDLSTVANYFIKINPDFIAGANVNLIYEKIESASAVAFSTDFGLVYLTPIRDTSIDIALKHIGSSSKMDLEKIKLPITGELGMATAFKYDDFEIHPALKFVYMQDQDDILPAIGVNVKLFDILSLRAGYKFNYNEEDFSTGIGINYRNFSIDYSFMNFNNDLDSVHLLGMGYSF